MAKIGRLITAMVTPFNSRGEVDYKQAQKLAKALIDSGSDGLVVTGTTGERPTLTDEEQLDLFTAVREAIGKKGCIIAGSGGNCTRESITMTEAAAKRGGGRRAARRPLLQQTDTRRDVSALQGHRREHQPAVRTL